MHGLDTGICFESSKVQLVCPLVTYDLSLLLVEEKVSLVSAVFHTWTVLAGSGCKRQRILLSSLVLQSSPGLVFNVPEHHSS
jgi:hypothetical protein